MASMPATTRANWSSDIAVGWWLWMSMTGNLAFGTGCSAVFSVVRGLYWVIVGSGNSGVRPSPGRPRSPDGRGARRRRRRRLGAEQEPGRDQGHGGQPDERCAHAWTSSESTGRGKTPQWTCKPNSVRRRPALRPGAGEMTIPLGAPSLTRSSDLPGSDNRTGRPNGRSHALPYLVLLRAGFGLPRLLPAARCALTAPFHPYLQSTRGGIFSVPLSVGSPRPGITRRTALWSSDFPPLEGTSHERGCPPRRSSGPLRRLPSRRSPVKCCTARASCRDCSAVCRSPRPSSRCSSRSPAAWPPGRPAPSWP